MANGDAFDRVKRFLEEFKDLPTDAIESRVKNMETDIYTVFNKLEKLHSSYPEFKNVDLSEDIYSLVRMLNHRKISERYPLLARAAAVFNL